jgi:hypothetical protein
LQPGAKERSPIEVSTELSYDDGASWQRVPGKRNQDGSVTVTMPAVRGDAFVSLRLTATDAAGNRLEQTITRAWRVTVTS